MDKKFAKWGWLDRNYIDWNSQIGNNKCVGSGTRVTSCGRKVFGYDYEKKSSFIVNPLYCMVGCVSYETWCIFSSISFPDKQYIKNLIKEKRILQVARKQLMEKRGLEE